MAARSDQLHSHQFTSQRVVKALALRDPDAVVSPTRRAAGPVVASVMVAVLALAAAGVFSVLRPNPGTGWRDGNAVIIEQESGARFVFRAGVLHPVLNHTSALLILGATPAAPVTVPRAALADVPRGKPLGIPGAPDPLPPAAELETGGWRICSRPNPEPGTRSVESVLFIGADAAGAGIGDAAVLTVDEAGGLHMVWQGHRYPIEEPAVVTVALGWSGRSPTPVDRALLNAIPAGPALAPISLAGHGQPAGIAGHRIGDVLLVQSEGGARQYAVAVSTGVADITQVQADLLLADPAIDLSGPAPLTPAEYAAAARAPSLIPRGEVVPPAQTPALAAVAARGAVCATFDDAGTSPRVSLSAALPPAPGEARAATANPTGFASTTVDWICVRPGHGAVVESRTGAGPGALSFVSDQGIRFPLPARDVLTMLGYGGVTPPPRPSELVALLPVGPALDPAAVTIAA